MTIKEFNPETDRDANRKFLDNKSALFMVEQVCMPSPTENGLRVLVYKTTIRINSKTYVNACYTRTHVEAATQFANLQTVSFQVIMSRLGVITPTGAWQQLLKDERLRRFYFF